MPELVLDSDDLKSRSQEPKQDPEINSLVEQLKNTASQLRAPEKSDVAELKPEQAEGFVVQKASELVTQALELVRDLKADTRASGDAEGIEALAKLIAASASALEALNKVVVADKKIRGQKDIKKMEIEAKSEQNAPAPNGGQFIQGTREEIFKMLVKEADVIDINTPEKEDDTTPETPTETPQ